MSGFVCDRCGKPLLVEEDVRYVLKLEVMAAYDPMELTSEDLAVDRREEIADLIAQLRKLDPQELEDSVYKKLTFDLCPVCRRQWLKDPLGRE